MNPSDAGFVLQSPSIAKKEFTMPTSVAANPTTNFATIHSVEADGVKLFYREAGPADAPVLLLLHGFPTSSLMFRELMPRLASRYRVIAPDLPGFGFTEVPAERKYGYTFDSLATTINAFVEKLGLTRYAIYVFDYGAPTGLRLALAHPERITAIISQNGHAYEEVLASAHAGESRRAARLPHIGRDSLAVHSGRLRSRPHCAGDLHA